MVFDINSQMKLAQSLTELTLRNLNATADIADVMGHSGSMKSSRTANSATTTNIPANPFAQMMDPAIWANMMPPGLQGTPASFQPFLWWPLKPEFLSMNRPQTLGLPDLGLPNMAIPLGLNPFEGKQSEPGFQLPAFSTRSPLAGDNSPEWPNMFWWLVQKDDADEISPPDESDEATNPWAMIMDPFGILKDTGLDADQLAEPEPDADIDVEEAAPNPFQMMFDPFGLLSEKTEPPGQPGRHARKSDKMEKPTSVTALDLLDPFGLMKAHSAGQSIDQANETSRNMFFGFQPGAKHPHMNAGRPTGMFYLAIALPEEIRNINPYLPPWNIAF